MTTAVRLEFVPARLLADIRRRAVAPLRRGAADVRQRARDIIKPGGTSAPGDPPRSHNDLLRRLIVYHVEEGTLTATVGPLPSIRNYPDGHRRPVNATVPNVLEFGGRIRVREMLLARGWVRQTPKRLERYQHAASRLRTVDIEARPYMRPALEATIPKLLNHFRDMLTR